MNTKNINISFNTDEKIYKFDDFKSIDYENYLEVNKVNNNQLNSYLQNIQPPISNSRINEFNQKKLNHFIKDFKSKTLNSEKKKKVKVKNIYDFNRNLFILNSFFSKKLKKIKNIESNHFLKVNIKSKLYNSNYFSNILKKISSNPKNINWFENLNSKKKRTNKTKFQIEYLNEFFELNNYQWNEKVIDELSKELNLTKNSIYKWNWDMLKKKKMDN